MPRPASVDPSRKDPQGGILWSVAEISKAGRGVLAKCSDCGATTHWTRYGEANTHRYQNSELYFWLLQCDGCQLRGLAKVTHESNHDYSMNQFWPGEIEALPLPESTPEPLVAEFRESELCASVDAHRAATAMLRSVLEKALKAAGYSKEALKAAGYKQGNLQQKIDLAAKHGVLTATLKKRAHDNIRAVGNDVLHEAERKVVLPEEYDASHRYAQQILVALYDHRETVLDTLWDNGLTPEEGPRSSAPAPS